MDRAMSVTGILRAPSKRLPEHPFKGLLSAPANTRLLIHSSLISSCPRLFTHLSCTEIRSMMHFWIINTFFYSKEFNFSVWGLNEKRKVFPIEVASATVYGVYFNGLSPDLQLSINGMGKFFKFSDGVLKLSVEGKWEYFLASLGTLSKLPSWLHNRLNTEGVLWCTLAPLLCLSVPLSVSAVSFILMMSLHL